MTPNQNPEINELDKSIANAGLGNTGVRRSGKAGGAVDTAALAEALERSNQLTQQLLEQNKKLEAELAAKNNANGNNNAIEQLAQVLAKAVNNQPIQQGPTALDEINRTVDFKSQKAMVDGKNLAETQAALQEFRNEKKYPITVSKSLASHIGPNLVVTVNGIRVSIPCDGKPHFINETHYLHAKERIAKVDAHENDTDDNYVTIG